MKRILLSALLIVAAIVGAMAQPQWTYNVPKQKNDTYRYVMDAGVGATENEARTQAIARIFQQTGNRLGQPVNTAEINRAVQRGDNFEVMSSTFNIKIINVDYFAEKLKDGTWRYYLLCQVQENANIPPKFTKYHDPDGAIAVMESAFIPGLGQMLREHKSAGAMILAGEVVLVGTGAYCYLQAHNKLDVMRTENVSYADYSKARDDYNKLKDASYVIWGAAAGLYVFNLFSAYAMKRPKYKYAFTPVILQDEDKPMAGVAMRIKF